LKRRKQPTFWKEWAVLCVAALTAYAPSLRYGFVQDDYLNVVDNPFIRSIGGWLHALREPMFPGNLYRPITLISHGLVYSLFGLNPIAYHAFNITLHALVGILLNHLFKRWLESTHALLAALVFIVLPVHVEAVANITGRAELIAACFGLGAVLAIGTTSQPSLTRTWLSTILLLFAILSKESGIVWCLPLTLLPSAPRKYTLPICCGAVVTYMTMRGLALGNHTITNTTTNAIDNPLIAYSFPERWMWGVALLGRYAAITIIPWSLGNDYSFGSLAPATSLVPLLSYLIVVSSLIIVAITKPATRSGLGWFFASFLLTANIVMPIGTIFAERLVYTPSIGLVLMTAVLATTKAHIRLLQGLVVLWLVATWLYLPMWKSDETLYSYQVDTQPRGAKSLINHAVVLRNRGEIDQGMVEIREALDLYPESADAAFVMGTLYIKKEIMNGAEHWFHKALDFNPRHIPTLQALGRLYLSRGDIELAEKKFTEVLTIDQFNVPALNGALAVATLKRDGYSIRQLQSLLVQLAPNNAEFKKVNQDALSVLENSS